MFVWEITGGKACGHHDSHSVCYRNLWHVYDGFGGPGRQELPSGFPNCEGVRHQGKSEKCRAKTNRLHLRVFFGGFFLPFNSTKNRNKLQNVYSHFFRFLCVHSDQIHWKIYQVVVVGSTELVNGDDSVCVIVCVVSGRVHRDDY